MIRPRSALRRLRLRLLPVPGQALGLAVLVAVLAAALVSAPLMVASAEQAAWKHGTVSVPGVADAADAGWATVAVVPQRFGLLEELTLADNVALAARLAGHGDPRAAAIAILAVLRLAHLADRMPGEVSLGEQQRTALARALVVRPAFLVADEPTARLDDELSMHVLATLRDVHAATGTGVLIAGHDPVIVEAADRVVRLSDGLVQV